MVFFKTLLFQKTKLNSKKWKWKKKTCQRAYRSAFTMSDFFFFLLTVEENNDIF